MKFWSTVLLVSILIISVSSRTFGEERAFFRGLGSFPESNQKTDALIVSADGTSVVATGIQLFGGTGALFWDLDTDRKIRFGATPSTRSKLTMTFPKATNGTVVVGSTFAPVEEETSKTEAFMWTEAQGIKGLGDLPGGEFESSANAISADGTVVAGTATSEKGTEAFVWTEAMGMRGLGDLSGGEYKSRANAISADGTVVAGTATSEKGTEAFVWTEAMGMKGLGDIPRGEFNSSVTDMSADGTVVVGRGNFEKREPGIPGYEAMTWTEADGMQGLGHLPSDLPLSIARAVSDDGSTIVGISAVRGNEQEVFIWDNNQKMRSLKDVLEQEYSLDLSNWSLTEVSDISADGLTIVGSGFNWQERIYQGWAARLGS